MLANALFVLKINNLLFKEFRDAEESTASTARTWKFKYVEIRDKSRKVLQQDHWAFLK